MPVPDPAGRSEASKGDNRVPGRFAYHSLERLFHERARLSIVASLAAHREGLVFVDLKTLCSLTDGNLSRQLQTLQEAGVIEIWKGTRKKRPQTLCRLTAEGTRRFEEYVAHLRQVIEDARTDASRAAPTASASPANDVATAS